MNAVVLNDPPGGGNMYWKKLLDYKDIRFWLILFFIVRLYAITLPPLERQHPWRQADGLMITRNFYEHDANPFYPAVDIAGEKTGITGSEFPILNYLMFLCDYLFGYQHWYGRIIVLMTSTLGALFFYKTIIRFFSEKVAFSATIVLTTSYWFSYSRKIFPDCFAASLCLIAIYCIVTYLERGRLLHLLLFIILAALGGLSKISALLLLASMSMIMLYPDYINRRKIIAGIASLGVIAIVGAWYFLWVPHLNDTYGYGDHFTTGCPLLSMGWDEIVQVWPGVLRRIFILPMKYMAFAIFLVSVAYILYKKNWPVFGLFLLPFLFFLAIILKTGKNIIADQYYVLCVIPAMAFIVGYGLAQLPRGVVMYILLGVIAIENIGDQVYDFRIHPENAAFGELEALVDQVSERDDLFVINSDPHCPTVMYHAHRKGWTFRPLQLQDPALLTEVQRKGAKFLLICKQMYSENRDMTLDLPQLVETDNFRIYDLRQPAAQNK